MQSLDELVKMFEGQPDKTPSGKDKHTLEISLANIRLWHSEISGLRERFFGPHNMHPGWKWWCASCGTLSNDGECDCTRIEETANLQRLVRNP